jgi:uncharacterized membrane protein YoaT (DUF817 family)
MIEARWHKSILRHLERRSSDSKLMAFIRELTAFGYKEALSCLFPAFIFGMLAITKLVPLPFIARYDLLLLACIFMQYVMYRLGMESTRELLVICFFHLLGISMEIFKVSHGAWAYPEPAYTKFMGVPLYSGFMYASVASYICQAWRYFDLRLEGWPSVPQSSGFACAIYGNFYSNAYLQDARLIIIPLLILSFWKTSVRFTTNGIQRRMPMVISFVLIAFFLWIAENVGTFFGAWRYPYQEGGWSMVRLQLMSSWFLLVIVSVIIVALLKKFEKVLE